MGSPQKIINRAKRRTDYFRMGRAEAQVACQFSAAVLTFANLLPNAIGGVYKKPTRKSCFRSRRGGSTSHLLSIMSKVLRRVTSDEAVLSIATAPKGVVAERESGNYCALLCIIVHYWEAVGRSGKVPFPRIVSLCRETIKSARWICWK